MGRRIRTGTPFQSHALTLGPAPAESDADGYIDRLLKYIPADIIALYLGVTNVVPQQDPSRDMALWIITVLVALCTPFYLYATTREQGEPTPWSQIAISSVAFPIWVFAMGGPFASLPWYEEKRWVAAVIISFFTFLVGTYKPRPAPEPEAGADA